MSDLPPASKLPLGKKSEFPEQYAPDVLHAIPRAAARAAHGIGKPLPFSGVDIWNAWELTWLDASGKPVVATAELRVAASSRNIVESKSLKLYLDSFSQTRFESANRLRETIARDIGALVDGDVQLSLNGVSDWQRETFRSLPGTLIDDLSPGEIPDGVEPGLLRIASEEPVSEELHSHLLRSLCPVTNQPDTGSLFVRYRGPRIDRGALLTYIVSFRRHNDFHEACVERQFMDIKSRCRCAELTVYARYNRRGGIDINPFRTDAGDSADNTRLWRQ